ncbi:unnamed protein product, partial [Staurois parvus]
MGTGGWHCWAQVGGTSGRRCVTLQSGTGGCTAGHRWVHCWAQVGGASGRTAGHRWAELAGGTAGHRSSGHVRKVQPENRHLHFPLISVSLDTA